MIVTNLYDPIFKPEVLFVAHCDHEQLNKELSKRNFDGMDCTSLMGCFERFEKVGKDGSRTFQYLIWMRDSDSFYTLIHECLHLTKQVFVDRGIPFIPENHELIAYYQEHWFKKLWRLCNKGAK